MHFSALAIFVPLYIAFTLAIGYWASRRIKTSADFMLAGRNLSTSFVGVTLFATWFGASAIMGNPSDILESGVSAYFTHILTGTLCLFLVGYFYVKYLYKMNIVTVGDFIQARYNKKVDLAISMIMVFTYFPWIASQFVALSLLFQSLFGVSMEHGILISAAIIIFYTYIGGMWAVSYTDMLQSILILLGLFILLFMVLGKTGGILPILNDQPREFYNILPKNNMDSWSEYIAISLAFLIGATPVQEIYQRAFSAKSPKAAVNGVYLGGILMTVIPTIPIIIAMGAVKLHPELLQTAGQSIIPAMVTQYAGVPMQVLFFGALISAILSTSSGAILAPATIIGENLLKPNFPKITDKKLLLYTRIGVVAVALVSCVFAFNDSDIVGLVVASLSLILVCIFAPFTFGFFWKRASVFGAWSAIVTGGLVWLICYLTDTRIAPTIYGTAVSCAAMVIGSLIKPDAVSKALKPQEG